MLRRQCLAVLVSAVLGGCADDVTVEASQDAEQKKAEETCNGTRGTISGSVFLFGTPPDPNAEVAGPEIEIVLGRTDGTDELRTRVDAEGRYEVLLEAGTWVIGGDDNYGCFPAEPIIVNLDACATVEQTVVLDVCIG